MINGTVSGSHGHTYNKSVTHKLTSAFYCAVHVVRFAPTAEANVMNAEIDSKGRLLITPNSHTEASALKEWMDKSSLIISGLVNDESRLYRGSKIMLMRPNPDWF